MGGRIMPRMTAIACDHCGKAESGTGYAGLMRRLRKEGWEKGPKPDTFFCGAPACRKARKDADALEQARRGR